MRLITPVKSLVRCANKGHRQVRSIFQQLGTYPLGPRDINGPCLSDGQTSGIQPQRIQERLGMYAFRLFTAHQLMIYCDHN